MAAKRKAVKKKTAPKKRPVAKKAPVKSSVSHIPANFRHHIYHTGDNGVKKHVAAVWDADLAKEICRDLNKAFVGKFTHEQE